MDELIDVVDDNDNVIWQELKSTCHLNQLLHRWATILCFKDNSYKKILLNKRSLLKRSNAWKLCFPGGHISAWESYLSWAQREFCEEMMNSKGKAWELNLEELFKIKKFTDNDPEYMTVFRIVYDWPFEIDPSEVESFFFEDFDSLDPENEIFTWITKLIIKEYKKRFQWF